VVIRTGCAKRLVRKVFVIFDLPRDSLITACVQCKTLRLIARNRNNKDKDGQQISVSTSIPLRIVQSIHRLSS
jgi:hypothetical protein